MQKHFFNKLSIGALALVFSAGAYSFGGGGGGNDGELPPPETCTSNCGFERGPAPNLGSLQAARGPFSTTTIAVDTSVDGFRGGTIYYPLNTSGELAAIAVAPGSAH